MVFKPFTHIARPILAKGFTHGYAQSLVAASQSSYASQSTSLGPFGNHSNSGRFTKANAPQLHNAFHNVSTQSSISHRAGKSAGGSQDDGGLAAYYAAWQQGEKDKEWKQFQFVKTIEWSPSTSTPTVKGKSQEVAESVGHAAAPSRRAPLERPYSADAVQDIKKAEDDVAAEAVALARVDQQIAREIETPSGTEPFPLFEDSFTAVSSDQTATADAKEASLAAVPEPSPVSSAGSAATVDVASSEATSVTSMIDSAAEPYLKQISELRDGERYAEIPATFEAMLVAGIKPTATAYNALLAAAIELPVSSHQVVPKALDVYADMMRRGVTPNTATYTTLIDLLASRSMAVSEMKTSLEQRRIRFGGMEQAGRFMFRSNETDRDILNEDDSLRMAVRLFDAAQQGHRPHAFPALTYHLLTTACASHGLVSDMIRIYAAMEAAAVVPAGSMFPPMIDGFAASSNLNGAVECYNEYKALAIAADSGNESSVVDRRDEEVYAAVLKAYLVCGKAEGGSKFLRKIREAYAATDCADPTSKMTTLMDAVATKAFVGHYIQLGSYSEGLEYLDEQSPLSDAARHEATAMLSIAAADHGDVSSATAAYDRIPADSEWKAAVATPLLALHVRQGDVEAATPLWQYLSSDATQISSTFVEPTTMYSVALIGSGRIDEGLYQARLMFDAIRCSTSAPKALAEINEQIDEAIEVIGRFLAVKGIVPSAQGSMNVLWSMIENGGLVSPVADQVLAGVGPEVIAQLESPDLILMAQVQAGIIHNNPVGPDAASMARFAELLEMLMHRGVPVDFRTQQLIEQGLHKLASVGSSMGSTSLSHRWQGYLRPVAEPVYAPVPFTPQVPAAAVMGPPASPEDTYDPYGASTDFKGSTIIADELEKNGSKPHGARLDDSLSRFRNMRRVGRHPRYITYAKLISAAAREDRMNLAQDILAMARSDVPLLPQYRMVRYGWASILDAMVGACLTMGHRVQAAQHHQELLDMGAAPTANTFGLYITTLKESTKTFDEATEAVRIFHRAKSEGVEPSSFLYNALIGKLGKARRIDDCLFYFAEMRGLGIRPTSVTYGTIVNALCRVSDEKFAEELFEEMETMPNYKPRPAPYNSLIQFFLTTKRDRAKVLQYAERMRTKHIAPTMHTYKLLIDAHATLEPVDLPAAEGVFATMRAAGQRPEAVHYASLIHAKGCVLQDMAGARKVFDDVLADRSVRPQACLYQAVFEAMVANHQVADTEAVLREMKARRVDMTPYIANTLIHGWALSKDVAKAKAVYDAVGAAKREPSTYEAMVRAYLAVDDREGAMGVVKEMSARRYPAAVAGKILELVSGGHAQQADAS